MKKTFGCQFLSPTSGLATSPSKIAGGLRDGMAHELSLAEAKDWDLSVLDNGHLVASKDDEVHQTAWAESRLLVWELRS